MNGERVPAIAAWRPTIAVISGMEAAATAVWLIPASVHIVQWPASGPVRLALLAPSWQLVALCGAALALAIAVIVCAVVRGDPASAAARHGRIVAWALPFSALWLWAIPYLPWLPDHLPLLLILAGPLRWAVAAAVAAALAADTDVVLHQISRLLRLNRAAVFLLSLALYLTFGLYSAMRIGPSGDEPHYLVITESLLKDGDLKIENNHRQRDYLAFYPGELRPDYFERGKNGEIYSIHAPGLAVMVLPAYAIAGRPGAVALICLLAALAALAVFDLAEAVAGRSIAVLTWAAVCLSVPFVPHAWLIFPEMPGALIVAWAALWIWRPADQRLATWVWRGTVLSLLPWLHTKFVVFLAVFAGAMVLRMWRRLPSVAAFLAPIAISVALWLSFFYVIYGSFDPEAPYGAYTSTYVLTENIPHGLLGIFFDQKFGLLFYSPIYLCAIAGAWLMLRRRETAYLAAVLLLATIGFVGTTARLYMFWGGSSAPARFLVPLLPCLAPMVAIAMAEATNGVARALIGIWLIVGLAVAAVGVVWPDRFYLFSDPHGRARILEALQGGSPLALVVPTFTDPNWVSEFGRFSAWLGAAALALVATVFAARRWQTTAWRLGAIVCLSFLLGGAIVSAKPDASVREETARRGDLDVLWRFDGNRLRTFDYARLGRVTPEQLRELCTMIVSPQPTQFSNAGFTAGPFNLPAGAYDVVLWFAGERPREGQVTIAAPQAVFARTTGPLQNPARVPFDLPVDVRRVTAHLEDARAAEALSRMDIVPRAVLPPSDRENVTIRAFASLPGRDHAYLVYTDEHAYPEGSTFWSRGTVETRLLVAPGGAHTMTLVLSTGPMSGEVTISVGGNVRSIPMAGGQTETIAFDLPPGQRLVPLTIQSTVMFRPAEVDPSSADRRGLGCQVRIRLE